MKIKTSHSATGVRFRDMDDETLRKVLRRTYRFAADTTPDRQAAQTEVRRRKAEGTWTLAA